MRSVPLILPAIKLARHLVVPRDGRPANLSVHGKEELFRFDRYLIPS